MLLFWDFQHGPSKSEIILDKNLCLINILFKGRSASTQDETEEWRNPLNDKWFCDMINYNMLSIEDPKKYPRPMDSGESLLDSATPNGGSCIISEGEPEPYSFTIQECDCSDPKNYDFYNKGRF